MVRESMKNTVLAKVKKSTWVFALNFTVFMVVFAVLVNAGLAAEKKAAPNSVILMPIQFNSGTGDSAKAFRTGDKLDVTVQLEIDAEAAQDLLPTWVGKDGKTYGYRPWPIGPTGKPILMVNYTQERKVDYMAGDGYNEIEFYISAEFVGEKSWEYKGQKYNGAYGVVGVALFPSRFMPLLVGREILGTPKLLADVKNLVLGKMFPDDKAQTGWFEAVDKHDKAFIAGALRNVVSIPYEALAQPMPQHAPLPEKEGWGRASKFEPGFKVMLWKYIPAVNWDPKRPDISYNMAFCVEDSQKEAEKELSQPMAGDGNIVFPNALVFKDHPDIFAPVNKLKGLVEKHSSPFAGNVLIRHYSNAYRAQDMHVMDGPQLPAAYAR